MSNRTNISLANGSRTIQLGQPGSDGHFVTIGGLAQDQPVAVLHPRRLKIADSGHATQRKARLELVCAARTIGLTLASVQRKFWVNLEQESA